MTDVLERLQQWYLRQCDGEWEHGAGVKIATLDNPGWMIDIHLGGTALAEANFERVEENRSDADWIYCEVVDSDFRANCGARNLAETLSIFLDWAESASLPVESGE